MARMNSRYIRASPNFHREIKDLQESLNQNIRDLGIVTKAKRNVMTIPKITELLVPKVQEMKQSNEYNLFSKLRKNKKGTATDIIGIVIIGFVFSIMSFFGLFFLSQWNSTTGNLTMIPSEFRNQSQEMEQRYVTLSDGWFLLLIVGLCIGSILGALAIRSHPAFYFVSIIILILIVIVTNILGDVRAEFVNSEALAGYTNFPLQNFMLNKLPVVVVIFSSLIAVVTYAKGD